MKFQNFQMYFKSLQKTLRCDLTSDLTSTFLQKVALAIGPCFCVLMVFVRFSMIFFAQVSERNSSKDFNIMTSMQYGCAQGTNAKIVIIKMRPNFHDYYFLGKRITE